MSVYPIQLISLSRTFWCLSMDIMVSDYASLPKSDVGNNRSARRLNSKFEATCSNIKV